MCREQRDRQAVQAERGAGGVCNRAVIGAQSPGRAEMILMVVEAHAGRRRFLGVDRNEQLELERLLNLIDGHQLAGTPEEGIARRLRA